MDFVLTWLNASASALISAALLVVILNPKVRDGIVIKIGLICMSAGFGAVTLYLVDGVQSLARPMIMITGGIAVVIVGYLIRTSYSRHPIRRKSDWLIR